MDTKEYNDRKAYYRAVVRSVGVPPLFEDDAIQDIFLQVFRKGFDGPVANRWAAIDAVRRYGVNFRSDTRHYMVYLSTEESKWEHLEAYVPDIDKLVDFERAWATLCPKHREFMLNYAEYGGYNNNGLHLKACHIRKFLREAMVA